MRLLDGRYTAALVLHEDNSNPEHGRNLIACLDYIGDSLPELQVFRKQKWLVRNYGLFKNDPAIGWYDSAGLPRVRSRFLVMGNVSVGFFAPKDSRWHCPWPSLGEQILHSQQSKERAVVATLRD